ncbi:MAG TPA: HNH endonuclease signature motif containing protein, partial [Thermomicrobiales bacterium]|nr:HNH endonuclease signature motif containing protein [Thermomicrobiales bacterium]
AAASKRWRMRVFDSFPDEGRVLLGRPTNRTRACRSGYGLVLQQRTGQTRCAYCNISLIDDYYHWLLMSVDHVVPRGKAQRLGIPDQFYEDVINLVLCCVGCNGFGNRYRCSAESSLDWSLATFLSLRDRVFDDRSQRIALRRTAEMQLFAAKSWERSAPASTVPTSDPQR